MYALGATIYLCVCVCVRLRARVRALEGVCAPRADIYLSALRKCSELHYLRPARCKGFSVIESRFMPRPIETSNVIVDRVVAFFQIAGKHRIVIVYNEISNCESFSFIERLSKGQSRLSIKIYSKIVSF